jgi:hypothetical protein
MVREVQTLMHTPVSSLSVSGEWDLLDAIDLAIILPYSNKINLRTAAAPRRLNQVVEITRQIALPSQGRVVIGIASWCTLLTALVALDPPKPTLSVTPCEVRVELSVRAVPPSDARSNTGLTVWAKP